jgi:hypothetical protein
VTAVVVAGYLLFCHGCHGDEDNELLATLGRRLPVGQYSAWSAADSSSAADR